MEWVSIDILSAFSPTYDPFLAKQNAGDNFSVSSIRRYAFYLMVQHPNTLRNFNFQGKFMSSYLEYESVFVNLIPGNWVLSSDPLNILLSLSLDMTHLHCLTSFRGFWVLSLVTALAFGFLDMYYFLVFSKAPKTIYDLLSVWTEALGSSQEDAVSVFTVIWLSTLLRYITHSNYPSRFIKEKFIQITQT